MFAANKTPTTRHLLDDGETSLDDSSLLRPHRGTFFLAILAAIGEGLANLLDPWPLKGYDATIG